MTSRQTGALLPLPVLCLLRVATCGGTERAARHDFPPPFSEAQKAEELRSMRKDFIADIDRLRAQLFVSLPEDERRVYARIHFRVNPSDFYNLAQAWEPDGDPAVEISVGFIRSLQFAVDAISIENSFDRPGFLNQYAAYVARGLERNRRLADQGRPVGFIKAPGDF